MHGRPHVPPKPMVEIGGKMKETHESMGVPMSFPQAGILLDFAADL